MDDEAKTANVPSGDEAKDRWYKRRSAEAVNFLAEQELKMAAARLLAVDPDFRETFFMNLAQAAWREAVGTIAANSNDAHPSLAKEK